MDGVLQLAHVARPVMARERARARPAPSVNAGLEEVLRERQDVLGRAASAGTASSITLRRK